MIKIRQIKVAITSNNEDHLKEKISKKLSISKEEIKDLKILKKSLDARDKNNIMYIYEVTVSIPNEEKTVERLKDKDIIPYKEEHYQYEITGTNKIEDNIVIVGSGPAGLFCAYMLSSAGYKPIIIERGEKIEDRVKTVEEFFKTNKLNPNSNIQFGEGGAGTFSDGKLNTLVQDKLNRGKKVFEIFIENGAPKEIMYENKPHIGTDILRNVIINMRNKIINKGGTFLYNTALTDINIENNKLKSIIVNNKEEIKCSLLVLAIGHSARDTFHMLNSKKLSMKSKPFAVGVRVEHPQEMISKSQYGKYYKLLPPAAYKLTYTTKDKRGVYSFCMCPGGFVVNASSEENHLVVNGMSNNKRDEENANSAIVVTVNQKDFGNDIFSGLEFQRKLEKLAYEKGSGKIPVQLYKDFCNNEISTKLGSITPNTKGSYVLSNLNEILPEFITESIKEAMPNFGKKISGFDREDTILLGVETRTSSPIIIERDENGESNIKGIYPCGEGSGYAGGITTAAIDGIKTFEHIISKYQSNYCTKD